MSAINNTPSDVKAFISDGINSLIEDIDDDQINYSTLKKIALALCPHITGSELLTKIACKSVLYNTVEERMVDAFFVAVAMQPDIETRSALIIAMSSSISLIDLFGGEALDKVAFKTADKLF